MGPVPHSAGVDASRRLLAVVWRTRPRRPQAAGRRWPGAPVPPRPWCPPRRARRRARTVSDGGVY